MHRLRFVLAQPILIITACLLFASAALADVVILKNRVEYRGAIVSEDVNQVTILSDGMEWTFSRDKIDSIKRDKKSAAAEVAKNRRRLAQAEAERTREEEQRAREARAFAQKLKRRVSPAPRAVAATSSQIVVYGTSWCGFCRRARNYFSSRQVPFIDKDVERDLEANGEMHRKCDEAGVRPRGVPVIDMFGTMVLGFDQGQIDRLLAEHGY